MIVKCAQCSGDFWKFPSQIRKTNNNFCSKSCAAKFNNKKYPKRKPEGKCKQCLQEISASRSYCKECRKRRKENAIGLLSYSELPQRIKERKKKSVVEYRRRTKLKAIEYKGGGCQICGYNKCVASLVFHHLDPSKKDFNISHKNIKSWERIKKEIDKCVLLCQNCHGEVHYNITELKLLCPSCKGKGYTRTRWDCRPDDIDPCHYCDKTGRVDPERWYNE
jgi:hypothetical protein